MGWFQTLFGPEPSRETLCARCQKPVRDYWTHTDYALFGTPLCSAICYSDYKSDQLALKYSPEPDVPSLSEYEHGLLSDKSSHGMYFDRRRCAYCGQVCASYRTNKLTFCSDACRDRAIQPFLRHDHTASVSDDYLYHREVEDIQEVAAASSEQFAKNARELGSSITRGQMLESIASKILKLERGFRQDRISDKERAFEKYLENWQLQRAHVLKREQQADADRLQKEQEALRKRREKEDEMKRKESERQASEEAERVAYEQSIAPRPVPDSARLESTLIVAGGGWGKTQLLQSIIADDLQKDDPPSYIVLDSTGAMIEAIQRLKIFDERLKDRILILDPAFSPALNMLDFSAPRYSHYTPEQMEDLETEITSLFNYVFASNDYDLSGQMGTAFAYAIKLMMSRKGSTLFDLTRLLEERPKSYQQSAFAGDIDRLNYGQDFFQHHFFVDSLSATRSAIARRIHSLLKTAAFRRMFGVSANKLDLFEEMNKGTMVLVNTNVNLLKEDGMALFGRYIIGRALAAAFERSAIPFQKRRPTFLMVDEAAPYFDETFEKLFTRARQFRVANIVAFQHLLQASDRLVSGLTSSTRVKYAGALSATDRRRLALDMETTPELIASLKKDTSDPPQWSQFACYVRPDFPTACIQTIPFYVLEKMPKMTAEQHVQLLERNRQRTSYVPPPTTPAAAPATAPAAQNAAPANPPLSPPGVSAFDDGQHTEPAPSWGDKK